MASPSARYDLIGAFNALQTGYVLTPEIVDALNAAYAANNYAPLSTAQLAAAALAGAQATEALLDATIGQTGGLQPGTDPYPDPLPPLLPVTTVQTGTPSGTATLIMFPEGLPRIPDSNEEPFDGWVQYGPWQQGIAP